jgi:hypothetical protein
MKALKNVDRGTVVLLIVFLLAFPSLFKPWIHGFDTVAYYSWLRTAVMDGNLNVGDEFEHYGYGAERGTTATGYTYNEWAVGSAVLWLPFFLVAHGFSLLSGALGSPVVADGYGAQYIWAVSIGSAVYAFIGVLLTYRLCRALFSPDVSTLATLAIWLGGPLVFYMYSHPLMSHANDAFAYALYLYTWYETRRRPTRYSAVLRGATAGLCALVRQINAALVFFALAEFFVDGVRAWRNTRRAAELRHMALNMAAFSLVWWIVYTPQVIAWRVALGHWIEPNPYAVGAGAGFDWLHPHFLGTLFSTDRGLYTWSPLLLLATIGWVYLWQQERRLGALVVTNFAVQLSLIAAWSSWSAAAAFGQRFFTNVMPAFTLGLVALLNVLQQRVGLRWLVAGCALFMAWNGLLIVRYVLEDIPRMGPVPLDDLLLGQFTVLPRYFNRILEILLRRS